MIAEQMGVSRLRAELAHVKRERQCLQRDAVRLTESRALARATLRQAKDKAIAWLLWYNKARLRSTLAYVSPMQFESE